MGSINHILRIHYIALTRAGNIIHTSGGYYNPDPDRVFNPDDVTDMFDYIHEEKSLLSHSTYVRTVIAEWDKLGLTRADLQTELIKTHVVLELFMHAYFTFVDQEPVKSDLSYSYWRKVKINLPKWADSLDLETDALPNFSKMLHEIKLHYDNRNLEDKSLLVPKH